MFINFNDSSIRYTGRFAEYNASMTTTATGSEIEIAFYGEDILLKFDLSEQVYPFPHLWMQLDGGTWIEASLDWYLRIKPINKGSHIAKIVLKSAVEWQQRWVHPISPKVSFVGYYAEKPEILPDDKRKTIEFLGDSITEGVLTDPYNTPIEPEGNCRVFQDDVFATYAYITAQNLNLRDIHVGYGGIGLTMGGSGGFPGAISAYPYCFENAPVTYEHPDYILINYGTNDHLWKTAEEFIPKYEKFLELVTTTHPNSKVIVLTGFSGVFPEQTKKLVDDFNEKNKTDIFFIDSTGWIPAEPLHPMRDGHRIVASHLTTILKEKYNL